MARIGILLADDNLLVREGVRTLLESEPDLKVLAAASDYEELIHAADRHTPQVLVTDIRMPPTFQQEGIEAAREVRKRHPGTGIVVLSQYDEPEYAVALLEEGAAGCAYLLKDRVAEGDQLVRAVREVASGGSMLDPRIVEAMVRPVSSPSLLTDDQQQLLKMVAEGRPVKAIAVSLHTTPEAAASQVERLFVTLGEAVGSGDPEALRLLTRLHAATVSLEEQGETLSRMIPTGLAEELRRGGWKVGEPKPATVTVLMSDIRGYSGIAEHSDPSQLALQLHEHRAAMNREVLAGGGTLMQFVGDAVMAVFGAPLPAPDHADRAVAAARAMHRAQAKVNQRWANQGLVPFDVGIGLSTGRVAVALLGSDEHLEYSVVGDVVNLTQRIQQWAEPGDIVMTRATFEALTKPVQADRLDPAQVRGRTQPVEAYRMGNQSVPAA